MCRHLLYLGPPVTLAAVLLEPPHPLLRQSWAPADMRGGGTVNADGFGVGWYPGDGDREVPDGVVPVRYRRDCPMWADGNLPRLATATSSGGVLAAVRSGTAGMPVTETACAPFAEGRWLFSMNGVLRGWPDAATGPARQLPVADLLTLDAPTDAAFVWALVRHRLRRRMDPAAAVARTVTELSDACPGSRLNLLLTDGVTGVATTAGHALSVRRLAGGVVVASEPYDADPAWEPVPDGRLVTVTRSTVQVSALPVPPAPAAAPAPGAAPPAPGATPSTPYAAPPAPYAAPRATLPPPSGPLPTGTEHS